MIFRAKNHQIAQGVVKSWKGKIGLGLKRWGKIIVGVKFGAVK